MMTEMIRYDSLPSELRNLKIWCVYNESGFYNAETNDLLDTTNLHHTDFKGMQFCISAVMQKKYEGIAFLISAKNQYATIEMMPGDEDNYDRAIKFSEIIKKFNSYTESSINGGFTIICKGSVKYNHESKYINISNQNYIQKITGKIISKNSDVIEAQSYLSQLWTECTHVANDALPEKVFDKIEETETDKEIVQNIQASEDFDKFNRLYQGDWFKKYNSEADAKIALVEIISKNSKSKVKTQIMRIFGESALGRDSNQIVEKIVDKAVNKAEEIKVVEPFYLDEVIEEPVIKDFVMPPGRISELIEFIYEKSPRQVAEISTLSAFGYMSAFCGRCFNYSSYGLNTFSLILANTGSGKEIASSGFDMILKMLSKKLGQQVWALKNSSDLASGQGLVKSLESKKSSLSVLSEFGSTLARFSQLRPATHDISLMKTILEIFTKSSKDGMYGGMAYADEKRNVPMIKSPSYSILAESNPEYLYSNLNETMITNGFLNRFILLEYKGKRQYMNANHSSYEMKNNLKDFLEIFVSQCMQNNAQDNVIDVNADKKAFEILDSLDKSSTDAINLPSANEVLRHLHSRVHMKVGKLSAIMAVMNNPSNPIIDEKSVIWALNLVNSANNELIGKFQKGEIGADNSETVMQSKILKCMQEYNRKKYDEIKTYGIKQDSHKLKYCPYIYLVRKNTNIVCFKNHRLGATIAIKNTLKNLIELNEIEEVSFKKLSENGVQTGQYYKLVRKEQEFI